MNFAIFYQRVQSFRFRTHILAAGFPAADVVTDRSDLLTIPS